jgi:membrane protein YqaA with SNARE-associated domain
VADDRPARFARLPVPQLASFVWGFAEATLFFIVPDVLLTWIALDRPGAALRACVGALAGALVGGFVMYTWGAADSESALVTLAYLPAVSAAMCDTVGEQLRQHGFAALFVGSFTGVPYKIYAVQAGAAHMDLALFLLVSIPARLIRFALVTGMTILVCRVFPKVSLFSRRVLHVVLWTAFYVWFFWKHCG